MTAVHNRSGAPAGVRRKLGEMLLEAGLLTEAQLREALGAHTAAGLALGSYVVRQGLAKEDAIVSLLARQLKVARYAPGDYPIDDSLNTVVSAEVARKYRLVPLQKDGRLLTVAMLDPNDTDALDTIGQLTQCEVEPVICTERELNQLASGIYGISVGIGKMLEQEHEMEFSPVEAKGGEDMEVRSLVDLAEGAPAVRMVNWIIAEAVRESASDVHISPEKNAIQIRFRVDGRLREVPAPPKAMLLSIISRIKILANMDIAVARVPQDGRFTTRIDSKEINIRASTIPTINGENVVLRLLDMSATSYTLENLGMGRDDLARIETYVERPHGMILSTGPTGSGKTTSLYAILRKINTPDINIITVEDPVEYRVPRVRQVHLNTRAGMTFAGALRSILRQDPDVIMVGEIRDPETAQIAVQAALTGHRVLSTAHTNDAAGAITRLEDMGVEPFLVASVLMVTFAQRLLRRVCSNCRVPCEPPPDVAAALGLDPANCGSIFRSAGCDACGGTGYQGRIGVFEVMGVAPEVQEMIAKKVPAHEIARLLVQKGEMRTLMEDAARKVADGITTIEEAMANVTV
ncbi:MAG: general secretion pathway protein GspE [Lentisphaerae bacterium]|nr:general secretion pathway protein GspE [Lentisphaerota bacterium]